MHLASMLGFHSPHSVLVRSPARLDARDPSLIDTSLPVDSIPVVGPLASSLVSDGASDSQNSPISAGNLPSGKPSPTTTSAVNNGNSNGNGGENSPIDSPMSTSGGGAAPQPVNSSKTTPLPTLGNLPGSSGVQNVNDGSSPAYSSSTVGGGSRVSSGQTASLMASAPSSSLSAQATNFVQAPQSSLGSHSSTVGALATSPTTATAVSARERLSGGTIAGITIVLVCSLLALIIFVFRRRSIARRVERRNQWWFNQTRDGEGFLPVGRPRNPVNTNRAISVSRLSARSSFATNFDQGLTVRADSPLRFSAEVVPDYPPMAEVRERNSILISAGATVARRGSLNTMLTHGTGLATQCHAVSASQNNLEPMSVRPFSPSEPFFFPKPPPALPSPDSFFFPKTHGFNSSISSATTLVQVSTPPPALMIDLPPTSVGIPHSLTPGAALPPLTAAADTSPDPFADPVDLEFAEVEVIRRPFAPPSDDELMVYPGDHVRGENWYQQGSIHLDYLREADRRLPTFPAQKGVSYGSDELIGFAL